MGQGLKFTYTTINNIMSKLRRDFDMEGISERDVIEWAGEALEGIGAIPQYEQAVAFIEVKNHTAPFPMGIQRIIQIGKNNAWVSPLSGALCPADVVQPVLSFPSSVPYTAPQPSIPVPLDAHGMPTTDYDIAYYRPFFDLVWEYEGWSGSSLYRDRFTPVGLANHSFFNSFVCTENGVANFTSKDEYTVIPAQKILRLSFPTGQIAVAYLRTPLDEEGWPLIPDDYSYREAVSHYVNFKVCQKEFFKGREGSEKRYEKAESQWQWYCNQAGNNAMMPTLDDLEDMLQGNNYLIPRRNQYDNFFGALGQRENRQAFRDPDGRNNHFIGR